MEIIRTVKEMKSKVKGLNKTGKTISLVPTMGFLHEGHLSLIRKAKKISDIVVLSIFVNPTQFSPGEDFEAYPRDINRDENLAIENGVDYLFYPNKEDIYNNNYSTYVNVNKFSKYLCGDVRNNHFQGVSTIVLKLFNIVRPDYAVFGKKDAQQLRIIQKLVEDLNLDVEIVPGEIIRTSEGLALSSRNKYLNDKQKKEALGLRKSLILGEKIIKEAKENRTEIIKEIKQNIKQNYPNLRIDYIDILNYENWEKEEELNGTVLLAGAVYIGKARLIDNILISLY